MSEDQSGEIRIVLNAQVEAARHIRDCPRCRRLFRTAYEATYEAAWDSGKRVTADTLLAWSGRNDALPELQRCISWPTKA
jgi:hypothetical protein